MDLGTIKEIEYQKTAEKNINRKIGQHLVFKPFVNGRKVKTLIDNGSEAELIDRSYAHRCKFNIFKLEKGVNLILGNGKRSERITEAVLINVDFGEHAEEILCYLADLKEYSLVLGDGWLQLHNPSIDWKKRSMSFNSPECLESGCLKKGMTCTEYAIGCKRKDKTDGISQCINGIEIQPVKAEHFLRQIQRKGWEGFMWAPREEEKKYYVTTTSEDFSTFMQGKPEYTEEELLKKLPKVYHGMVDLFMKSKADELAPHRKEDHEINLIPGSTPPHAKNYRPMSEKELAAVKKYIDEHLGKGFIRPSSSSASSPVLLARKPGGGLRFCVDYRGLNALTVKNRYPIPLLTETLGKLSNAKMFTKLDVIHAFNRIRIKEGHEWLTAFNTRYGQFEYLVMPFGLCNAPGTFQSYINNAVREYLDIFCTAYLDDILIYSESEKNHDEQVLKVLKKLREKGLQVDIDKCEFKVTKVKYLGLIITTEGIQMDAEKIEAIMNWETPTSVKEVQGFLGFANFYRRFIKGFSKRVRCLTELTRGEQFTTNSGKKRVKYQTFQWTEDCQKAFENLKEAFASAPTLAHYDSSLETWVETDASDFVVAGVLSQMHDGILRPVAFFSKSLSPAECNYMIYDKELLAIIRAFETWRPEIASADPNNPIKVYTDHKNLEHFMTTKQLNRRQIRWAEFLSEFNFKIMYRPGKQGKKPDALTRRAQDLPKNLDDPRKQHQYQTLLQEENLDEDIKKALSLLFYDNEIETESEIRSEAPENEEENEETSEEATNDDATENTPAEAPNEKEIEGTLDDLLDEAYEADEVAQDIMEAKRKNLRKLPSHLIKKGFRCAMGDLRVTENRLYINKKLYAPESPALRVRILRDHHDSSLQGHPGYKAMYKALTGHYFWLNMKEDCKRYAVNCSTCRRTKAYNTKKQGLLNPLPIPNRKWSDLSVDYVEFLPKSRIRGQIYQHILVIVDRLTKRRLYEPMTSLDTEELVDAMRRRVFSSYGLPISFVNDRGTQLISKMWKRICERYKISIKASTAFHPETDGQTENANKTMKNYLRAFTNYAQDNWADLLPDAEFAANSNVNASTGMTPFFADHGYEPRSGAEPPSTYEGTGRAEILHADDLVRKHEDIRKHLQEQLTWAQEEQARYANRDRQPHPEYKVGDRVYVNAKDLKLKKASKSLSSKNVGPWEIIRVIDNKAYELDIPDHLRKAGLYPVFHPWKLHLAPNNPVPGQILPEEPLIEIDDGDGQTHTEWTVLEIVDCRKTKRFGLQYKATFSGNYDEWNTNPPWQPWTDFERSIEKVLEFHRQNPRKPQPPEQFVQTT